MSNPFDDILSPQPKSARSADFQNDPFADEDDSNPYGAASSSRPGDGNQHGNNGKGKQSGYAMDPFFDE